ncbi:hypothetical protein B0188_04335 [[Haemophilus] felis]|uniref:ABC transporter domain-containing protein n=1 Tax=[Haemophilus] felis TaxID=123822 RepID=A0A1T0B643_9PAST|nr:ATP-binding cassette domain-containing protein [[Haemophilus] felis]OOS05241.1 hypothetical protein B0188_04335 [[Haemophilus] felis]
MTTEPILRLQNIVKKFGDHLAVNNISLDIFRGEILALLGENGAGKSSLIKIWGCSRLASMLYYKNENNSL